MNHFYYNIEGWFFSEDVYAEAVRRAPTDGAHFVEVGSWKGKSTSFMAIEIATSGKHIQFDCVDNWKGSKNEEDHQIDDDVRAGKLFEIFKKNLGPALGYVHPITMDSAAAAMLYRDSSLDFIYIDAAHDYESVKKDIVAWLPKLKLGGIMAGDDFTSSWPGVVQAVKEVFGKDFAVSSPTWIVDTRKVAQQETIPEKIKYDFVVRTHSGENLHVGKRFIDATKSEIITRCLNALITSANLVSEDIKITIIDDYSDSMCITHIEEILKKSKHPTQLISNPESGTAQSLKACYEFARDQARDIVYFIEDDYLHFPSAISEMFAAYSEFKKNIGQQQIGLFPVDYPDRYVPNQAGIYESRIVLGTQRHWRTVQHSTFTFFTSRSVILNNWHIYEELWKSGSGYVSEDSTVNKVWQNGVILFSPIPSLAIHLQFDEHKPPFIEWKKLWEESV